MDARKDRTLTLIESLGLQAVALAVADPGEITRWALMRQLPDRLRDVARIDRNIRAQFRRFSRQQQADMLGNALSWLIAAPDSCEDGMRWLDSDEFDDADDGTLFGSPAWKLLRQSLDTSIKAEERERARRAPEPEALPADLPPVEETITERPEFDLTRRLTADEQLALLVAHPEIDELAARGVELSADARLILAVLAEDESMSAAAIGRATGINRKTVGRTLTELKTNGRLRDALHGDTVENAT